MGSSTPRSRRGWASRRRPSRRKWARRRASRASASRPGCRQARSSEPAREEPRADGEEQTAEERRHDTVVPGSVGIVAREPPAGGIRDRHYVACLVIAGRHEALNEDLLSGPDTLPELCTTWPEEGRHVACAIPGDSEQVVIRAAAGTMSVPVVDNSGLDSACGIRSPACRIEHAGEAAAILAIELAGGTVAVFAPDSVAHLNDPQDCHRESEPRHAEARRAATARRLRIQPDEACDDIHSHM